MDYIIIQLLSGIVVGTELDSAALPADDPGIID